MPNSPVTSLVGFANTLKKNGIRGNVKSRIDNLLLPDNSGSMILDFLTRNKINQSKTFKNFQRKLVDTDMRLGGKAYKFLDSKKGKIANSLKNSLVQEHDILKSKGVNGMADTFIKVNRTGILNPINKVKNSALPFVGSLTVANHLLPKEDE